MHKIWSRRLLEVSSRSAIGGEHDGLIFANLHSLVLERMAGGRKGAHQRAGSFFIPGFEQSTVVDVGAKLCRLCGLFPGGHVPVELRVAGIGAGSPVLVLIVGVVNERRFPFFRYLL
eukprot:580163-Heterocapsa_arctica.AAC.1